jgi:hypothetical protein
LRYDSNGDVKSTFSDGTPITATHVQMTFARLFRLGASMAADVDYTAGARQFKASHKISDFGVKVLGRSATVSSRFACC